jgi:hypothetical protein
LLEGSQDAFHPSPYLSGDFGELDIPDNAKGGNRIHDHDHGFIVVILVDDHIAGE